MVQTTGRPADGADGRGSGDRCGINVPLAHSQPVKLSRQWAHLGAGDERVGRGLNLGDVLAPCGRVDVILIRAALPVDEFPDDVGVASVLGSFRDHPDEQDAQGRISPAFRDRKSVV